VLFRGLLLSTVLASILALSVPATAQYPQDAATAGVSDTTVAAGQSVTVGGEGWAAGSTVTLRMPSADLGPLPVDARGEFSAEVTVPVDVDPGEQLVTVSGTSLGGEPSEIGIRLLVAGPVGTPKEDVDFSGSNIILWAGIALALFLVGAGAVGRVRRRAAPPGHSR
jgi:hypothetical protein